MLQPLLRNLSRAPVYRIVMASLEVPNSTGTDSLLARLIGDSGMETNVSSNGAIISRKGTIRGVQDTVKNTVQNFKKMKSKPDASPMLRRVMEVSVNTYQFTQAKSTDFSRRNAGMKWMGGAGK